MLHIYVRNEKADIVFGRASHVMNDALSNPTVKLLLLFTYPIKEQPVVSAMMVGFKCEHKEQLLQAAIVIAPTNLAHLKLRATYPHKQTSFYEEKMRKILEHLLKAKVTYKL